MSNEIYRMSDGRRVEEMSGTELLNERQIQMAREERHRLMEQALEKCLAEPPKSLQMDEAVTMRGAIPMAHTLKNHCQGVLHLIERRLTFLMGGGEFDDPYWDE